MDNAGGDPVTLFLRSILALGRRVRAERPPGALSLSGLAFSDPCTAMVRSQPRDWRSRSGCIPIRDVSGCRPRTTSADRAGKRSEIDRRELIIAITAKGRRVLLEDMAARRSWLNTGDERRAHSRGTHGDPRGVRGDDETGSESTPKGSRVTALGCRKLGRARILYSMGTPSVQADVDRAAR